MCATVMPGHARVLRALVRHRNAHLSFRDTPIPDRDVLFWALFGRPAAAACVTFSCSHCHMLSLRALAISLWWPRPASVMICSNVALIGGDSTKPGSGCYAALSQSPEKSPVPCQQLNCCGWEVRLDPPRVSLWSVRSCYFRSAAATLQKSLLRPCLALASRWLPGWPSPNSHTSNCPVLTSPYSKFRGCSWYSGSPTGLNASKVHWQARARPDGAAGGLGQPQAPWRHSGSANQASTRLLRDEARQPGRSE